MEIRKARKEEAGQIATIMILAMTEIVYQFIGKEDLNEGIDFLASLILRDDNQYSHKFIYIAVDNNNILGQMCLYPGEMLNDLRKPVLDSIKERYGINYLPANETQAGEIYIDTIAVSEDAQGQGIGKKLIEFAIQNVVITNNQTLGLLVDEDNPNAQRLYERLGFKSINDVYVFDKNMSHMQYTP